MRYLKFFLILCCSTLAAEELDTSINAVENVGTENTSDKDNTPLPTEKNTSEIIDINKTTQSYESAFIKTIFVLGLLLSLFILTLWIFKKISRGRLKSFNSIKSIKILEKRPLSAKSVLYLIEVSGKQVLIAESQLDVTKVESIDFLENDRDL